MSKAEELFLKAQVELAEGDVDKAVKSLKASIKADPKFADAHFGLALTYLETDNAKDDDIIKAFTKALEVDDENAEYHLAFGNFLLDIGKFGDAEVQYNLAADLAPEDSGRIYSEFAVLYYDRYLGALEARIPDDQEIPEQPKMMVEKKALEYLLKAINVDSERAKKLLE